MTILGVFTALYLLILCAIIYVMAGIRHYQLANSISSNPSQRQDLMKYFDGSIGDPQATQATQAKIVRILSQDPEKLDDFLDTLDTSLQSPIITERFYGVGGIVASLNEAGFNINNRELGSRLNEVLNDDDNRTTV